MQHLACHAIYTLSHNITSARQQILYYTDDSLSDMVYFVSTCPDPCSHIQHIAKQLKLPIKQF